MKHSSAKHLFLVLLVTVGMASIVSADAATFDGVCASLAERPNTLGNFAQEKTITNGGRARTLKSGGTFVFSLQGIVWNTAKPFPSTLVVGLTSVIQTTPDGKQIVIDASTNQVFTSISATLVSLYSGDSDRLNRNFNIDFDTQGKMWRAMLTPRDKTVAQVLKQLVLSGTMEDGSAVFDEIVITESSGEAIKYMFTNMTYPKELSSDDKELFQAK